jgi:V8-like Glu-specific endopeptidase
MEIFLDKQPPYDFADPVARDLWDLLASNYLSKPPVQDMLVTAGVDRAEIDWDQPMKWVWADILTLTHKQARLRPLLQEVADGGDAAVASRIAELIAASPVTATPSAAAPPTWKGFGGGLEKIIEAESTFLDIAFLRRGVELGTGVCRLLVTLSGVKYYGTAFRIAPDFLLTNHHVLFDHDHGDAQATAVEAWFGYERSFAGLDMQHTVVLGDPASIVGQKDHDWAVVRTVGAMPDEAPVITLTGSKAVRVDDRVYIIQHPGGAPKKIGMIHNVVRHVDDDVVQYLTDTEGGSSGSPVFNERWEVVALHHEWAEVTEGGVTEIRNQGRRIERVVEGLQATQVI